MYYYVGITLPGVQNHAKKIMSYPIIYLFIYLYSTYRARYSQLNVL